MHQTLKPGTGEVFKGLQENARRWQGWAWWASHKASHRSEYLQTNKAKSRIPGNSQPGQWSVWEKENFILLVQKYFVHFFQKRWITTLTISLTFSGRYKKIWYYCILHSAMFEKQGWIICTEHCKWSRSWTLEWKELSIMFRDQQKSEGQISNDGGSFKNQNYFAAAW